MTLNGSQELTVPISGLEPGYLKSNTMGLIGLSEYKKIWITHKPNYKPNQHQNLQNWIVDRNSNAMSSTNLGYQKNISKKLYIIFCTNKSVWFYIFLYKFIVNLKILCN